MAVWFDKEREHWCARASGRHPVTKKPSNLVRICFKTKAEAERAEKILIKALQEKFSEALHPMFEDVLVENIEMMKKEGDVTGGYIQSKEQVIRKHTLPDWELKRIDQITTLDIRRVITEAECSIAHQKEISKFIRQVFEFAVEAGYINRNPCPKIRFKINQKMFEVLNESELKFFLKEAKRLEHPWYYIWAVAIHTGMRSGELYALEVTDVDLETGFIKVSKTYTKRDGYKDSTKGNYDRIIEISPPLKKILEELIKLRGNEKHLLHHDVSWDGGRQAEVLRKFLGEIGLPSIRFHDLRASWATLLLTKGIPPAQTMKLGGWRDWKVFQRYIRKAGIDIKGASKVLSCLEDSDE